MQEKRFRNQISWLMFSFSILVIWVHSYNVELFAGGQQGPAWERAAQIETFWSVGIGQIAVPGFFLMSSYLFFRNFSLEKLAGKWKSRFFSVAVPYAVWNLLYYLGYVAATRLPMVERVVGKDPIPFTIEETLRAVLHYSYAPIFWYLYQLVILLVLAPAVYALVKNKIIGFCYLAALIAALYFRMDTGHPNTDALFYFSFAAYAAVHFRTWLEAKGTGDRILAGLAVMIVAIFCYGTMKTPGTNVLWTIMYRLLTPVSLFLMTSSVELPETKPWMRQSLFLYAIHFIVVRFMNKGSAMILADVLSEEMMCPAALGIYFAIPVVVVMVSYLMARILSHVAPPLWRILSGGRNL
ncbi:MAG: acyltransferase [Lachnospiraceae bacterium]|nr:acyltransferase [Lachnospiraceae bacterium]